MKKIKIALNGALLLCLTASCTNTLYQADLDVLNSEGKARKAILYWTKTEQLLGKSKAGPIVLMTACSTRRINFDETASGIFFRGTPGYDRFPGQVDSIVEGALCGTIESESVMTELKSGPLLLTIKCEAVTSDFDLLSAAYIQAREAPYRFDVRESRHWSFLGAIPDAPKPPDCK